MVEVELTDEERDALLLPEVSPVRRGLDKLIEGFIQTEQEAVSDPRHTPDSRQFEAGRLSMVLEMRQHLETLYKPRPEDAEPASVDS
jgi:hypothetical protein